MPLNNPDSKTFAEWAEIIRKQNEEAQKLIPQTQGYLPYPDWGSSRPCPSCGHCPHCGRGGYFRPHYTW